MEHQLTDWSIITRKTIKSVWYKDYMLTPGGYDEQLKVYVLNEGYIILETTENEWFLIQIDTEWMGYKEEGLHLYRITEDENKDFHRIKFNQDKIWSQISNKTIKQFQLFQSTYYSGKEAHPHKVAHPYISGIELRFLHGECLYIFGAAHSDENHIEESLYDLALFTNRQTGVKFGLITEVEDDEY